MSVRRHDTSVRLVRGLLLVTAAILFALHYRHLSADFPNHSPWMDWAKYTDEGWYGDAAIRHFNLGHWYVRGDFNPAAALPVWPVLEGIVFHFTGVGVVPARALTVTLFGLILLCGYALVTRALRGSNGPRLAPAMAVLLLAASPFCYAFMRMAILEPPLVVLTLGALLVADALAPEAAGWRRRWGPVLLLGLLLPAMVLTKTTALFLFPAIAWTAAVRCGFRLRTTVRVGGVAGALAIGLWLLYYGAVVRPHYLDDYRYLFEANAYTFITPGTVLSVLWRTVLDGAWIGRLLFPVALAALLATLLSRRLRLSPLPLSLVLWALGYGAFLAYHNNLQPRYYLVIAVPLTLLLPLVVELLWVRASVPRTRQGILAVAALLPVIALLDARQTLSYVRSPEYTFLHAAEEIRRVIDESNGHSPLLLSISGSDIALMTGLPSICDDFGTLELENRVKLYKPGWYASWNEVDDDKMDALTPLYHLERVTAIPAMDDPDRNLLILYRLDPAKGYHAPRRRRRQPLPRSLITRLGQQPSAIQLQH